MKPHFKHSQKPRDIQEAIPTKFEGLREETSPWNSVSVIDRYDKWRKNSSNLIPTRSQKRSLREMKTSAYVCSDVAISFAGPQVSSKGGSSPWMKSCLPWNKHTTVKTIRAGPQRLPHIVCHRPPPKFGVRRAIGKKLRKRQDSLVFVEWEIKIDKELYQREIRGALLLSWTWEHFDDAEWTFQMNSAPVLSRKRFKSCA